MIGLSRKSLIAAALILLGWRVAFWIINGDQVHDNISRDFHHTHMSHTFVEPWKGVNAAVAMEGRSPAVLTQTEMPKPLNVGNKTRKQVVRKRCWHACVCVSLPVHHTPTIVTVKLR
jgi:hypothetical protein